MKKLILNFFITATCIFIALLSPIAAYSQTSKFPPTCPSKQEVQQANLDQATYNKNTRHYDVQTEKWIVSERNWIISTNVSANSPKEAISKAYQYLTQMKNSPQIKAKYLLSPDGNLIFWICSWKTIKNAEIKALSMSIKERN